MGERRAAAGPRVAVVAEGDVAALRDPVDGTDDHALRAAAVQVFAHWIRALPRAPRDARLLVRRIEVQRRASFRRDTVIEGRRLVWHSAPYEGPRGASGPPLDAALLDPWSPPADLQAASRHVVSCAPCTGSGRIECPSCGGDGRRPCDECAGAGKARGIAANGARRLLKCRDCAGKGRVICARCDRGKAECPTCHGTRRLECWLEIETWQREEQFGHRDPDAALVADIAADGVIGAGELPDLVPDALRRQAVAPPELRAGERVGHQRIAVLAAPSVAITYGAGRREQVVELTGRHLRTPPRAVDTVLAARARVLSRLAIGLAVAPVAAAIAYVARGAYFAPAGIAIGLCMALLAAMAYLAIARATLTRRGVLLRLAAAPVPLVMVLALAAVAEPDLARAQELLAAGRLDRAATELAALGTDTAPALRATYADLRLARVERASTADQAAALATAIPADVPQRAAAQARIDALSLVAAQSQLAGGRADQVVTALAQASPALRGSADARALLGRAALAQGEDCLRRQRWTCALGHAADAAASGADAAPLRAAALAAIRDDVDGSLASARTTRDRTARVDALRAAERVLTALETASQPEAAAASRELAALRGRLRGETDALERERAEAARRAAIAANKQRAIEDQARRAAEVRAQRAAAAEARAEAKRARTEERQSRRPVERTCCKICSRGCPCGDSCISCSKTCHKGRGCAC
jgi:hypothetical protein